MYASPRRPSASGLNPWGSRAATRRSGVRTISEKAPVTCEQRLDDRLLGGPCLRAGVQVEDDLGVARRLEDRALAHELAAQFAGVDQVAVVADRDLAVGAVDQQRLGVQLVAVTRRRVADVPDGRVPGQRGEHALVEDVGHVPHRAVHPHAGAVRRGDARALLPAVLQGVNPEVSEVGRLRVPEDAEDAALLA